MSRKKKLHQIAYKFETIKPERPVPITATPFYPQPVKIGKTTLEFHTLPTSKEMAKLQEKDRIMVLGLVMTPAAHNTLNYFASAKDWVKFYPKPE
jgi:hypothetical protein